MICIILGIVVGIKISSTGSTASQPNPSGSPYRQNISVTGPSNETGFVPTGITIAPTTTGSYVLGRVDCNGYVGTSCEEYCIRLYDVAPQGSTNTIVTNHTRRSPATNCVCDPLTSENGIGQYSGQVFAIAPTRSTTYVLLGTADQGCNLTYYLVGGTMHMVKSGLPSSPVSFLGNFILSLLISF